MKSIIILLLLPIFCYSQEKGATKIIIKNELSAKDNFDLAVKTLMNNDIFIEQKDAESGYIKTQVKSPKKGGYTYYLNIRTLDNKIEVSGMFKSQITINEPFEPIINRGMKGSYFKISFDEMANVANYFKARQTSY